jgi:hypothetical protein
MRVVLLVLCPAAPSIFGSARVLEDDEGEGPVFVFLPRDLRNLVVASSNIRWLGCSMIAFGKNGPVNIGVVVLQWLDLFSFSPAQPCQAFSSFDGSLL